MAAPAPAAAKRQRTAESPTAVAASGLRRGRGDYARTLLAQPSSVEGQGLFARVDFKRGAFVCDYFGRRVARGGSAPGEAEAGTHSQQVLFGLNDLYQIDPRGVEDSSGQGALPAEGSQVAALWLGSAVRARSHAVARFINHSCAPNLDAVRLNLRRDLALSGGDIKALRLPGDGGGPAGDEDEEEVEELQLWITAAGLPDRRRKPPPSVTSLRAEGDTAFDAGQFSLAVWRFTAALAALDAGRSTWRPAAGGSPWTEGGAARRAARRRASLLSARAEAYLSWMLIDDYVRTKPLQKGRTDMTAQTRMMVRTLEALKDASACIRADPTFVWGYQQKARALRADLRETKETREAQAKACVAAGLKLARAEAAKAAAAEAAEEVVVFFAARDIEAGAELSFDYGRACAAGGGEAGTGARACRCGAEACRGKF